MTHEFIQRELVIDLSSGDFQINQITQEAANSQHIIVAMEYDWAKYKNPIRILFGIVTTIQMVTI